MQRSEEGKTHADDEVQDVCDLADGELPGFERDPRYHYQWLNVGGRGRHLFRSLDTDAATRAYTSGRSVKVWHSGIALASVDNYTGAMNGILFFRADKMEPDNYPTLYAKVEAGVGHVAFARCPPACSIRGSACTQRHLRVQHAPRNRNHHPVARAQQRQAAPETCAATSSTSTACRAASTAAARPP